MTLPPLKQVSLRFALLSIAWTILCLAALYFINTGDLSPELFWRNLIVLTVLWLVGLILAFFLFLRIRLFMGKELLATRELAASREQFRQLVDLSPNAVAMHKDGLLIFVNQAGLQLIGAEISEQVLGRPVLDFMHPDYRDLVTKRIQSMVQTRQPAPPAEEKLIRLDGSVVDVMISSAPLDVDGQLVFQLVAQDLSQQKKLERALASIEEGVSNFIGQKFFDSAVVGLARAMECDVAFIGRYMADKNEVHTIAVARDGQVSSNFIYSLTGSPCENVVDKKLCCYPMGVADLFPKDIALRQMGVEGYIGVPLWDSNDSPSGIIVALYKAPIENQAFAQGVLNIFASRVQSEMERNDVMQAYQETQARLQAVFETIPFDFWVCDDQGRTIIQNNVSRQLWGDQIGKRAEDVDIDPDTLSMWLENNHKVLAGEVVHREVEMRVNGELRSVEIILAPVTLDGKTHGFLGMHIDVSERKRTEQLLRRSYERMSALREIDHAILGGVDISLVLDSILRHLTAMLEVDGAEIIHYFSETNELQIAARRGVGTYPVEKHFPLEGDICAQAILNLRRIVVNDFPTYLKDYPDCSDLVDENFKTYIALPLMAKGKVKGVLEFFHRSELTPDKEWWAIAESFADQVAIAIDNYFLFRDLQMSNMELSQAYDLTLEGWSRALEIRDHETEGHTRRVTELTMRLARAAGCREDELVHIRRGALLHDIGKMGIPDSILRKPGKLTEEEWVIIRKHPQTAFDLLKPIPFLRPALEIPHYHHERWDGTGYPHGLKGEQIPLAARIFTIVDVWDALINDRSYRKAMSLRKALDYMRANRGTLFDPQILDLFLKMVNTDQLRIEE